MMAYQLKRRAESQEETRRKIVEATIELHKTRGAAGTTISAIAQRAGVGRVTVYRHFPDELSLLQACTGHYFTEHPSPDLSAWAQIADPHERLRTGLSESYAWHRANVGMIAQGLADARDHEVMEPYHAYWAQAAEVLVAPFKLRGRRRRLLLAGIAAALSFDTWRTFVLEQGLSDRDAVEVALRLAA
jgi:AcrR family transcriptional regulator